MPLHAAENGYRRRDDEEHGIENLERGTWSVEQLKSLPSP
jgi:hypothetical protein